MKRLFSTTMSLVATIILAIPLFVMGSTVVPPFTGGTGTSTLPAYGKVLVGGKNGEYEFVATSSIVAGGTGAVSSVFGRAGAVSAQLGDYTTSLVPEGSNLYYTLNRWASAFAGTTTDGLREGTTNLYFTNARAQGALGATYPIQYAAGIFSLAFGTSSSNTWGGTQTFTNVPILGSLTGFIRAASGSLTTALINLTSDITGTLGIGNGGTGTTTIASGQLRGMGGTADYGVPTTTASCSGSASCSAFTVIGSNPVSITVSGGAGSSDAFTHTTYNGQSISATSTGVLFTSTPLSVIASSTFTTYASTTALTNSGPTWLTSLSAGGLAIDANNKLYSGATSTLSTISGSLSLTSQVSGILPFLNGGTGTTTAPVGQLIYGGTTAYQSVGTSTLTPAAPLTGSFTQIGSGGSLGLDTTGTWTGNAGTVTNGVYTTTFNGLFDTRFITDLAATTSVNSITTLATLSLPYSQLSGTPVISAYPWTAFNTFGTTTIATSSSIATQGVFYASSTVAASHFPYASTTALTATTASTTNLIVSSTGGAGTRCLHAAADGTISATAGDCGVAGSGVTSLTAGEGLLGGTITTSGTIYGQLGTSTTPVVPNIPYFTSIGDATHPAKFANVATTTLTGSGVVSISNSPTVIGGSGAVATLTGGSNGQVLAWASGIPTWVATTTAGTGLTYTGSAFNVNSSQSIATLSNLTNNGFVQTSSSNGTLGVEQYPCSIAHGCTGSTTAPVSQLIYGGSTAYQSVGTSSLGVTGPITFSGTIGAQVGGASGNFGCATCVTTSRNVNTTYPLQGGGALSGDLTLTTAFSTTSNTGIGNNLFIYTSNTGVLLGAASSSLSLPNSALQNSAISGVSLGGTLGSLSHGTTLTGTSYNGSAAVSNWDIDLTHANTWTGLQQFNGGASSTGEISAATASSTNLIISSAGGTGTRCLQVGSDGTVSANASACGAGSTGIIDPFTHVSYLGQTTSATGTLLQLTGAPFSLAASSTALFSSASTSLLAVGTQWFTGLTSGELAVDANGKVYKGATSTLSTISGQLDLTTQVTGDLPFANLAQVSANSVLGNITGATADAASISTTSLFAGTNGQVLGFSGGKWIGLATTTAGTGLSYSGTAFTVNTSQNITTLSNLGTNGFVRTSGSNGTLGVQTDPCTLAEGCTGSTTAPQGQVIYGGATAYQSVATSAPGVTGPITYSGTLGAFVGGAAGNFGCATCVLTSRNINTTYPLGGGGALSGDLTLSTAMGTTSTWGIGNDLIIYTSHTGVPLGVASSSLSLPNAALQNSTISGVALGGTLGALSHDTTLTGTSYTGTASVSNWGIDLTHGNTWTGLQQFNGGASSTGEISAATASSTNLVVSGIRSALVQTGADGTASAYAGTNPCSSNQALISLSALGVGSCSSTFALASRNLTVAGTAGQITSSAGAQDLSADRTWTVGLANHIIVPAGGIEATLSSSTNATTTGSQYFTGVTASRPLYVDSTGKLGSAGSGTSGNCVNWGANNTLGDAGSACGSAAGSAFPFTPTTNFGVTANATTTPIWFQANTNALFASSTIQATNINIAATAAYQQNGVDILKASTTGLSIFGGHHAGAVYAGGSEQTAFGDNALASFVGDSLSLDNTAVGSGAARFLQFGAENTAIGETALTNATNTSANTIVGSGAFEWSDYMGTGNTALGVHAGAQTGGRGNTFLGAYTAYNNATLWQGASSSNNNTLVGYQTGEDVEGSNNIVIGANSDLPTTTSNAMNIANLIYGTFPTLANVSYKPANGTIGIGSTTPFGRLSIQANNGDTKQTLFVIGSSTASATTTLFLVNNTGVVGIATSSPMLGVNPVLAVVGTSTFWGNYYHFGSVPCNTSAASGNLGQSFEFCGDNNSDNLGVQVTVQNNNAGSAAFGGITIGNDTATVDSNANAHFFGLYLNSSGYSSAGFGTDFANKNQALIQSTDGLLSLVSSTSTAAVNDAGINFITGGTNGNERARFDILGNFGIASKTPATLLSIHAKAGTTYSSNALFMIGSSTATYSTSTLFRILNTGVASTTGLVISNTGGTGTRCLQVASDGTVSANASACGGTGSTPGGANTNIQFNDGSTFAGAPDFVYQKSTSAIGIGTTSPWALLSIHATSSAVLTNGMIFAIASSTPIATSTLFSIDQGGNITLAALNQATSSITITVPDEQTLNTKGPDVIFTGSLGNGSEAGGGFMFTGGIGGGGSGGNGATFTVGGGGNIVGGKNGGVVILNSGNGRGTGSGGSYSFNGGNSGTAGGTGGSFAFRGGGGNGGNAGGGAFTFIGGQSRGSGTAGNLTFTGGQARDAGGTNGKIYFFGGSSPLGSGVESNVNDVLLSGGPGVDDGSATASNGGNVILVATSSVNGGTKGKVKVQSTGGINGVLDMESLTSSDKTFTFPDSSGTLLLTSTIVDPFTHPAAGQAATTSLMLFNGAASSTKFSATTAFFGGTATSTFTSAGFLGIATSTPFCFLCVAGDGTNPLFALSTSTGTGAGLPVFEVNASGHVISSGQKPTITSCGAGSPTITGNDSAGKITTGTAPTFCLLTFASTYGTAPACTLTAAPASAVRAPFALMASTSATTLQFMGIATSTGTAFPTLPSYVVSYICQGTQ